MSREKRDRLKEVTRYIHVVPHAEAGSDDDAIETDFDTDELMSDPEQRFIDGAEKDPFDAKTDGAVKVTFRTGKETGESPTIGVQVAPEDSMR